MGLLEALGWIVAALVEASPGAQPSSAVDAVDGGFERAAAVAPAATVVSMTTSESQLGWRANQLRACRADVAATRPIREARVPPGSVLLRWTVLADGAVKDTEVVALSDTDPALLACIERRMSSWAFARRPEVEPIHLEHELSLVAERSPARP